MKFLESNYNFNNPYDGKFILIEGLNGSGKTTQVKKLAAKLTSAGIEAIANHEPTKGNYGLLIRQIIDGAVLDEKLLQFLNNQLDYLWSLIEEDVKNKVAFTKHNLDRSRCMKDKLKEIIGYLIKKQPLSEEERQILFIMDRQEDITNNILPALMKGYWVVEDRYDPTNYMHGKSQGIDFSVLQKWHRIFLQNGYLSPDLIMYYWLPLDLAIERNLKSGKIIDIYENKKTLIAIESAAREIFDFKNINPKPGQPLKRQFRVNGKRHPCFIINTEPSLDEVFQETWRLVKETFAI
jgi:thymidylate kinase